MNAFLAIAVFGLPALAILVITMLHAGKDRR